MELITIESLLGSFPLMVAFTMWATERVNENLGLKDGFARASSWVVSFGLVLLTRYAFKVGFIMDYETIYSVLVVGLNVALVSNGVHTINPIKRTVNKMSINNVRSLGKK